MADPSAPCTSQQTAEGSAAKEARVEYKYGGKKLTPHAYCDKLKELKRKKQAPWWAIFNVLLVGNSVKIQCERCGKQFSAINPSTVAPKHFQAHRSEMASTAPAPSDPPTSEPVDEGSSHSKRARAGDGGYIRSFVAAASQITIFLKHLALFFFKCNIALHLIEHPDLVKACAAIGVRLPSRKVLSGKMLDEVHAEVSARMDSECSKDGGLAAIATTGWKNRVAFMGSPLIDVMKLLSFRAVFLKVVDATGNIKNAAWICNLHIELVSKLFKEPDDCIGFVMDNVKANRSAMTMLRDHNPRWLAVGCVAHGLSLYFKDIANSDKCPWGNQVVDTALFMSNTINGSERIRSALHKRQEGLYGRVSAITVNSPTRFACHYLIVKDLLANKDALQALVSGDEWAAVSEDIEKASQFRSAVLCADRYKDLFVSFERYVALMEPVSTAIRKLVGDRPMLSQAQEAVLKIGQHCKAFSEKYPEYDIYPEDKSKAEKSVLLLWEARFRSTLDQPAMQLAYLLDPVNFIKDKGTAEWCLPWSQFTLEQRQRMRQLAAEVFAGAGIGSTEGEKEKDKQDKMAVLFAEWGLILLMDVPEECSDYMPTLVRRTEVTVGEQTKVEIAGLPLRLKFWRLYMASTYPALAYVANRVLRLHATTCAAERDWSLWGRDLSHKAQERAEKLTYVRQNDDSNTSKCSALTDEEVVMDLLHGSDDDE